jgi:hypothetical protein
MCTNRRAFQPEPAAVRARHSKIYSAMAAGYVRYGSLADIGQPIRDVRWSALCQKQTLKAARGWLDRRSLF